MPLYTPDRQITPDDPKKETELVTCETCTEQTDNAIRDHGGLILCNHKSCIESARIHDLKYCYPSEENRINEYYDKLLNELK